MDKKYIIAIIIVVIIAICGVAYYMMGSSDDGVVTIGYLPSDHDAALFVADADNLYAQKGIETKLVQFNNGGDLMTAMASGEVDIGYVGVTPVLSSIEKGVPVKIVSGVQTEGSGIVVSNESGINSISDLSGKSIATPGEASIQYMLLQYALEKEGMNISDVSVSAMKVAPMNDALNSGKIDGMLTYEPYVSIALNNGHKLLENSSEILPDHPCCVIAASDDFINNHPDELNTILEIHNNTTNYVNENPNEAAEKLPADIVSDVNVEKQALSGINFISGLNDTYKQSIMDFMNIEVDMGLLKKPLTADQIFYTG